MREFALDSETRMREGYLSSSDRFLSVLAGEPVGLPDYARADKHGQNPLVIVSMEDAITKIEDCHGIAGYVGSRFFEIDNDTPAFNERYSYRTAEAILNGVRNTVLTTFEYEARTALSGEPLRIHPSVIPEYKVKQIIDENPVLRRALLLVDQFAFTEQLKHANDGKSLNRYGLNWYAQQRKNHPDLAKIYRVTHQPEETVSKQTKTDELVELLIGTKEFSGAKKPFFESFQFLLTKEQNGTYRGLVAFLRNHVPRPEDQDRVIRAYLTGLNRFVQTATREQAVSALTYSVRALEYTAVYNDLQTSDIVDGTDGLLSLYKRRYPDFLSNLTSQHEEIQIPAMETTNAYLDDARLLRLRNEQYLSYAPAARALYDELADDNAWEVDPLNWATAHITSNIYEAVLRPDILKLLSDNNWYISEGLLKKLKSVRTW